MLHIKINFLRSGYNVFEILIHPDFKNRLWSSNTVVWIISLANKTDQSVAFQLCEAGGRNNEVESRIYVFELAQGAVIQLHVLERCLHHILLLVEIHLFRTLKTLSKGVIR